MIKFWKLHRRKIIFFFGFVLFLVITAAAFIWPNDFDNLQAASEPPGKRKGTELANSQKGKKGPETSLRSSVADGTRSDPSKRRRVPVVELRNFVIVNGVKHVNPLQPYSSLFKAPENSETTSTGNTDLSDLPDIPIRDIEKDGIVGISNRRNSCYAASVLQTLFRVPVIRKIIANFDLYRPVSFDKIHAAELQLEESERFIEGLGFSDPESSAHCDLIKENIKLMKQNVAIIEGINHMFHQLQSNQRKKPANFSFSKTEQCMQDKFHAKNQEDANEYMTRVMTAITNFIPEEQKQKYIQISAETLKKYIADDPENNQNHGRSFGKSLETYNILPLSFPARLNKVKLSLKGLLDNFFESDVSDYKCAGESVAVGALEQTTRITSLPEIVPIQLKRYAYNKATRRTSKIQNAVDIPDEIDFAPYCTEEYDESDVNYQLKMFIYHIGESFNSGHYIAFSRESDGNWYQLNDGKVSLVPKLSDCGNDCNAEYYVDNEKDGKIYGKRTVKQKGKSKQAHFSVNDEAYIYFYQRVKND